MHRNSFAESLLPWAAMRMALTMFMLALTVGPIRAADATPSRESKIDRFAWEGPLFFQHRTLSELRSLAPLQGESTSKLPNPFEPGREIELHSLQFDGLSIDGTIHSDSQLSPIQVVITSTQWKVQGGLGVGARQHQVIDALGAPSEQDTGFLVYRGETERVTFHILQEQIWKIVFDYHAD